MGIVEITSIIMILFGVICILYSRTVSDRVSISSPAGNKQAFEEDKNHSQG